MARAINEMWRSIAFTERRHSCECASYCSNLQPIAQQFVVGWVKSPPKGIFELT
jgi:hypothetical protein